MYRNREKEDNYAQRARSDSKFTDDRSEIKNERSPAGSYNEVIYYSDGSSTVNFGGMGGKVEYDEFGNEC